MDILSLQRELVSVIGATGAEENRAKVIADIVRPFCDDVRIDNMFNVIAHKKGNGPRAMIAAHQDTLGLIVTFIEENGYLRFSRVGGINPLTALDTVVRFENGVIGRIGRVKDPKRSNIKASQLVAADLFIDVGARSRAEAEELVSVGDIAQYWGEPEIIGNDRILSPYLDDLISCVAQILALEKLAGTECPNDIYFVFTSQEEVGHRGAVAASYDIDPDWGVAVDVTPVGDARLATNRIEVRVGGGATVNFKNGSVISNPAMTRFMKRTAKENNIPLQMEYITAGGTDTEAIQHNRSGAAAGGTSIPTRHIHTPCELACLSDVENCAELLCALLRSDVREGGLL